MKKWLSVTAVVVLSLALVIGIACGGGEEEEEGVKKLKFGWGTALSGAWGAIVGYSVLNTTEMFGEQVGEFEVGGERYVWDWAYEDNFLNVSGGATSARSLIYEHNVFLMHQSTPDPAWAAAMITEEIPIILDMSMAVVPQFGPDTPHSFMVSLATDLGVPPLFDWITKEHPEVKRVAITYEETSSGEALRDVYQDVCDYYGLELYTEVVPSGTVEYYPVATKLMTHDPDFVQGATGLYDAMWDMGYEGLTAVGFWEPAMALQIGGWDRAKGMLIFNAHPIGGLWPEVEAFGEEFEYRYGMDFGPTALWVLAILDIFHDAIQQADTVDDVEKIVDTLETGTFDTHIGPAYLGYEEINGIGHVGVWSTPIYEIVGENEYVVHKVYTPEETEAHYLKVYRGR